MKTAIILDFDETIFRTFDFWEECYDFWIENHSPETNVKVADLLKKRKEHDMIFAPKKLMTDDEWQISKKYCDENALRFLYDDTAEFLQNLDRNKFQPIVLSYGEKEFQETKLNPLGLELPAVFLNHRDKTAEIFKWLRGDFYEILGEDFAEIVLIDDRDVSFKGFDNLLNARGFLVPRGEHAGKANLELLAKNVTVVKSLREIVL